MGRTGLAALVAALLSLAALPASALGQGLVVRGRVYDPASNDAGVQNAQVILGGQRATLSNQDGAFVFRGVPRGEYQLRIEALGYEELRLTLTLASDTTLVLPLRADPIELDPVGVVLETIDFDGRVRDPRTNSWVADAEVASDQGHLERSNLFGRFDLDDVFDGPPLRVLIRAFRYLPLDTTFIPDDQERYAFEMAPDPIMARMIDSYVARLDERGGRYIYKYQPALNREDLAKLPPNTTLREVIERKYSPKIFRGILCFFFDEHEYRFVFPEERVSVLEGTFTNNLERIEVLELPGQGRYFMARAYTHHFFQRQVVSPDPLRRPSLVVTPGGVFCQ
jgi:hypothetical protein